MLLVKLGSLAAVVLLFVLLLVLAGVRRTARRRDAIGLAFTLQVVADRPADISQAVHRIPTKTRRAAS